MVKASNFLIKSTPIVVIAIGLAVIVGWFFHIDFLKNMFIGIATMKMSTAVFFVLTGIALELWMIRKFTAVFIALCLFVTGASFASVIQYVLDINLGIDQILIEDKQTILQPDLLFIRAARRRQRSSAFSSSISPYYF